MFGRKINKFDEWTSETTEDEVEQINNRAKEIKNMVENTNNGSHEHQKSSRNTKA